MFTYEVLDHEKIQIYRYNKPILIVKGREVVEFLAEIEKLDFDDAQIYLAKLTGKYKFGNERLAKDHPRNQEKMKGF